MVLRRGDRREWCVAALARRSCLARGDQRGDGLGVASGGERSGRVGSGRAAGAGAASWPPGGGTRWWSAAGTTGSPRPPTSPGRAVRCSCWRRREQLGGACHAGPAVHRRPLPGQPVRVRRRAAAPAGRRRAGPAPPRLRPRARSTPASGARSPTARRSPSTPTPSAPLAQVAALAPADVDGYLAYEALFERIRVALRTGPRDAWLGPSPDRAELAELLDAGSPRRAPRTARSPTSSRSTSATSGCARCCTARA